MSHFYSKLDSYHSTPTGYHRMAANRLFFILSTTVVQVYFTWSLGYALKKQRITNMGIAKNT